MTTTPKAEIFLKPKKETVMHPPGVAAEFKGFPPTRPREPDMIHLHHQDLTTKMMTTTTH